VTKLYGFWWFGFLPDRRLAYVQKHKRDGREEYTAFVAGRQLATHATLADACNECEREVKRMREDDPMKKEKKRCPTD
jgi:hypothetical protein